MRIRFKADAFQLREPGRGTEHGVRTLQFFEGPTIVEVGVDRKLLEYMKERIDIELSETSE